MESYNSRIRHYLARFKRKTKCYSSKSIEMLNISLNLLMNKLNNDIYTNLTMPRNEIPAIEK